MKTLCMAFALSSGLLAPAARAAVDYDNLAVLVQAGAGASGESTTGDPGGTVVNMPTRPAWRPPTKRPRTERQRFAQVSGPDLSVAVADAVSCKAT